MAGCGRGAGRAGLARSPHPCLGGWSRGGSHSEEGETGAQTFCDQPKVTQSATARVHRASKTLTKGEGRSPRRHFEFYTPGCSRSDWSPWQLGRHPRESSPQVRSQSAVQLPPGCTPTVMGSEAPGPSCTSLPECSGPRPQGAALQKQDLGSPRTALRSHVVTCPVSPALG